MSKLTSTEVYSRFADVELYFDSYYKYVFTFKGTSADGYTVVADYGGGSSDIYRYEVAVGVAVHLAPEEFTSVTVYDPAGYEVFHEYDAY